MPVPNQHNPMLDTRIIRSIRQLVDENAKLYGDAPVYYYKSAKQFVPYSYREMQENMNAIGTALLSLGLQGENIAIVGEAHPAYMTSFYAIVNSGCTAIPLDKEISDAEAVKFLNLAKVSAIIWMPGQNGRFAQYAGELPLLRYYIPVSEDDHATPLGEKYLPYEALLAKGREALAQGDRSFLDHEIDTEARCTIIFTSGTTGTSKGVMLSQKNFCCGVMGAVSKMDYFKQGMRLVSVLPMNHTYEITASQMASQYFGTSTLLNDSLKYVNRNIKEFKPDALAVVPLFVETMHKRIWDEIRKKKMEKQVRAAIKISNSLGHIGIHLQDKLFGDILSAIGGNLTAIVCGGAKVDPKLITDFKAFGILIQEGYGITECSPLVSVNQRGKERLCSVGTPIPNCEVKIDRTMPDEKTGEVLVKGDNVMLGYYENEEATREAFTYDGWFRTGDIGYLDKDGYLFLTGRKKNVIILSNGKNVFPEELEEHLGKCEYVKECVVLGRKKESGETVITALIYPNYDHPDLKGMTTAGVEALLHGAVDEINRHLPPYKQMHAIELRETEFEKTTTLKIKRYKLK